MAGEADTGTSLSDEALIAVSKAEPARFGGLFERYADEIYRYVVTFGALWRRVFSVMWRLQAANDQRLTGGFDDFPGVHAQVVDLHDALDLGEQTLDEAEVAAGDAGDGCEPFGVGEVMANAEASWVSSSSCQHA